MNRLLGSGLLLAGAVMLYEGRQAHELAMANAAAMGAPDTSAKSVWLLALGAVAIIWGLFAVLRRTIT
ncbi:DUF3185 family protein [Opitutus terrae]|nr:DUF3185 family protein [Opitutus terrae]